MKALEVRGLSVRLGGRRVLQDVNFSLENGEFMGLIGPNGAGKTTTIRAILGLVAKESGQIEVAGSTEKSARSRIGYVPQRHEFAWDFPISVEDAVMTGLVGKLGWFRRPKVDDYRSVRRAIQRVGMSDLADRPVGELSGGQRQRVLVARALALNPTLMLLDEPFTGLDMPSQELLLELFHELAGEGRGVLMSTHDLVGAMQQCDTLCLINRTVIASGSPSKLNDMDIWMRAFNIKPTNPVLKALGVAA